MVGAKGNGDALTFISSPKIDNDLSTLTETTLSSPTKVNLYEIVIVSESENKVENIMEEVRNEEKAIIGVRNEENPIEEEDNGEHAGKENEEKNGEFSFEEEEEEENEENEDYGMEEENEGDAVEEKEEKNEEDAMEDGEAENDKSKEHNKEKVDANSNEKVRKPRKRNRMKKVTQGVADKVVSKDEDKPESKGKKQASKKVASMGMIFMCSSKTKKDCYRYKVLGLPASKKDVVQKIYKGMRLFLFDFDLRLMYGIYKAAGPGGSNIEPKAFKSAFPSQVRFTVLEDCLPIAEENFKKVIKDNYYSKNKFDCQLNSEQVKKLCKLFVSASKGSKPQKVGKSLVAERRIFGDQGRIRQRGWVEERGSALGRERRERRHLEHPVIYASQVAPLPRAPSPLYAYERTLEMDPYRLEPVIERRGLQLVELEPRHHYETGRLDPYLSYREREAPLYHEPVYSARLRREYYPPAALPAEYRPVGREAEYRTTADLPTEYRSSAGLPAEYHYRPVGREAEYHTTADLPTEYRSSAGLPAEYHSSASLLAEYRAAGIPTENLAPAGLPHEYRLVGPPTEYRSSSGALRDYHSRRAMHRY